MIPQLENSPARVSDMLVRLALSWTRCWNWPPPRLPGVAPAGRAAPSMRRRRVWGRSVERLLDAASRSASAVRFPTLIGRPVALHTKVVLACRAELLAIKGALGDQRQPISAAALGELKTFLCEPSVSPLFGVDPVSARPAAVRLWYCFTRPSRP